MVHKESSLANSPLWARLRGHGQFWHRTSLSSLEGVLREGAIVPNAGQFPTTFGQSKASYSRHLGAISMFDFDTADEPYIFEHEWKWGEVLATRLPAAVLIRIRRDALDRTKLLLPTEIFLDDPRLDALPTHIRKGRMVIPAVEALHISAISASAFSGFVLVCFKDTGSYRWHEMASDVDSFRTLSAFNAEWTADEYRRKGERQARGEFTLAERLEPP